MCAQYVHRPVQIENVLRFLITDPRGVYVDGTLGEGGHSRAILERISERGRLIGIERDEEQLKIAERRLMDFSQNTTLVHGNFADMDTIIEQMGIESVDGILLDLGISSHQIEKSGRGFSFMRDEPLDMRMDTKQGRTAYNLINRATYEELRDIIREFGEERMAGKIARKIIKQREKCPISSSKELAEIVRSVVKSSGRRETKDPATRTFQAIRIAINREIENLKIFLSKVPALIKKGGRLVILSYHSLEDRVVKHTFKEWEKGCICPPHFPVCRCGKEPTFRILTKRGLRPSQDEIMANPRARSSILRAVERV